MHVYMALVNYSLGLVSIFFPLPYLPAVLGFFQ